jgi:biopolymer transport protein ExbB
MNIVTNALIGLYMQAATPTTTDATKDAAAAGTDAAAAAAAAPPAVDAATAAAEKAAAAAANAKDATGGADEFGLTQMITHANPVEQVVMVILLLCAIYCLMLLFEKVFVMRKNAAQTKEFLAAFRKATSIDEAEAIVKKLPASGAKSMFEAGMGEIRKTRELGLFGNRDARDHTMQRVQSAMTIKQNELVDGISSQMTVLASIGANAPFIGLLGTVWGIMTAFIEIVRTQTTSLAAVAPGISSALLATAAGLFAAIPAVLIYNYAAKQISSISGKLEDFGQEFISLVSRDMDRS